MTAVPVGAKTVRQSVRRRHFGAGIPRRATRAVPEEFAQSRHERDLTAGSIRTQNPLPARACGFKSLLRHSSFLRFFRKRSEWDRSGRGGEHDPIPNASCGFDRFDLIPIQFDLIRCDPRWSRDAVAVALGVAIKKSSGEGRSECWFKAAIAKRGMVMSGKACTAIPASRGEGDRFTAVSGGRKLAVDAEGDARSIDREALDPWAITAQAASSLDPWPRLGRLPVETSSAPPHRRARTFRIPGARRGFPPPCAPRTGRRPCRRAWSS